MSLSSVAVSVTTALLIPLRAAYKSLVAPVGVMVMEPGEVPFCSSPLASIVRFFTGKSELSVFFSVNLTMDCKLVKRASVAETNESLA